MALDDARSGYLVEGEETPPLINGPIEGNEYEEEGEGEEDLHQKLIRWISTPNIAEEIDDDTINQIGARVIEELTLDKVSRQDWLEKSEKAMLLATQVAMSKTYPWPDASNVIYPLMTVAAVQFSARAYPSIISGRQVVKGVVHGKDNGEPLIGEDGSPIMQMTPEGQPLPVWKVQPGEKRAQADKIGDHMSYQLLEEQETWEEQVDKMLIILPIVGSCFKKSYFDTTEGYNCSDLVLAENLVINYDAPSMERAPRLSELIKLYPSEILEMEAAGLFLEKENGYGVPSDGKGDKDAPHVFVEQHRRWDLDGDGYPEPIIVTVHEESRKVVRIVARYDGDGVKINKETGEISKIIPVHYYTKFEFMPSPDGGIYGMGFGQLLSPINNAINTALNMMIDAGHLKNSSTGFIGRGLSLRSGSIRFKPFEYQVVNTPGRALKDAIVPLPFSGPDPILFELLGLLIQSGEKVASISDVMTGEAANLANMAPTTLMALIDQGLKVFTGIYKRVHRSLKCEYDKLYRLNYLYMEETSTYRHGEEWKEITREDYRKGAGIAPVSDPSMVSSMQKLAKAQFMLSFKDDPYMNPIEIRRRAFQSTEIEDLDQLILDKPPPNPQAQKLASDAEMEAVEMQIKAEDSRIGRIKDISTAVLNLAKADKENGSAELDWTIGQLDLLKRRMETENGQPSEQAQQQGIEQRGRAGGGEPPIEGARQAEDGNWYIDDPNRQGKYLMVA